MTVEFIRRGAGGPLSARRPQRADARPMLSAVPGPTVATAEAYREDSTEGGATRGFAPPFCLRPAGHAMQGAHDPPGAAPASGSASRNTDRSRPSCLAVY